MRLRYLAPIVCLALAGLAACRTPAAAPADASPTAGPAAQLLTATPTPDLVLGTARILTFTVTSGQPRPGPGDTVTVTWEAENGEAFLSVGYAGSQGDYAEQVPLKGSRAITLRAEDPVADHWADFTLYVSAIVPAQASVRLPVKCHYTWFRPGLSEWCPKNGMDSEWQAALGQTFEGGAIIRAGTSYAYVLFAEPGQPYRSYHNLPADAPDLGGLQPPAGRYLPAAELAALWLGDLEGTEDLRSRLGWATAGPAAYDYLVQCAHTPEASQPGYTAPCYAEAPDGRIFTTRLEAFEHRPNGAGFLIGAGTYAWIEVP